MALVFPHLVFANACNDVAFNPEVVFYSSYGDLKYDFSKDLSYVSNLATTYGQKEGFLAGGLALSTIEMSVRFDGLVQYQEPTDICVVPSRVEVFIGFRDPVIYVANHLKEGTCRYYVTLRHEQAHMQINKKALEYFLPSFKRALKEVIASVQPLNIGNVDDVGQANQYINQEYYDKIKILVTQFNEVLAQEQAKLDNAANYAYEGSLCK